MTTNAIDMKRLVIASDSRWSATLDENHVVVLDDSGFHKLAYRHAGCMVVAGDLILIEGWMRWFAAPVWDFLNRPALNRTEGGENYGIVFHLMLSNGQVFHPGVDGPLDFNDEARFVGTGKQFALDCFSRNRCAVTSVTSASRQDVFTGGAVLHVDFGRNVVNVPALSSSAAQVRNDMTNRGIVMDRNTREPICNFQEFAARKAGMGTAGAADIKNLNISAPTGAPAFIWSQEQEAELMKAFATMAVLEEDGNR